MSAVTAEGQILDNTYRLVRLVAEGGMGLVYEATHARLSGRYAIKVLPQRWSKDPDAIARFDREARITSSLQHPNIVQVIDFNTAADGTEYLVMEYLRGETLAARLAREGVLSLDTVTTIVDQVASGLAAAHAHGIVHRDLKPENILLMQVEGREGEWAKILDFGISKVTDASLTTLDPVNKSLIGTPQYMAPEQCEGRTKDVDAATDQFALAAITYEMLTGRRPFRGESLGEVLYRVLNAEPPPMNIEASVESVVRRGLAKSSRHRYSSVTAFAEALRTAASAPGLLPEGERSEQSRSYGYAVGELDRRRLNALTRRSHWGTVLVAAVVIIVGTAFVVPTWRAMSAAPASAAFPGPVSDVATTSTVIAQPTAPPVPERAPREEPPLASLGESEASALSNLAPDEIVLDPRVSAGQAGDKTRAMAPRKAEPAARRPVVRKGHTMTAPLIWSPPPAERAAAVSRPPEPVRSPQPPAFRPLPSDPDGVLPLDDKFNDSP